MSAFRSELQQDGVLVLTVDLPGEKVNTLSRAMMEELQELLAGLESGVLERFHRHGAALGTACDHLRTRQ